MLLVCASRLSTLRNARHAHGNQGSDAVESEVSALLTGKTHAQLEQLQQQIQAKLASGEPIDTDYWEGLLKSLLVWKAKVRLTRSLHTLDRC